MGRLYLPKQVKSKAFISLLRSSPLVVTVGDRVTETMQELGRTPDVQIIDEVERRVRRQPPDVPYVRLFTVSNPAGTITQQAIFAIRSAFAEEKPARVLVDGEEDLLVIPTIVSAPEGSTLFYGQPGEGVVLVVIDERAKASSRLLMSSMRRVRRSTGTISS